MHILRESNAQPVIGITGNYDQRTKRYTIGKRYIEAVQASGGIPFLLPPSEVIPSFINGIVLSGGGDIDPLLFGEEPYAGMQSTDIDPLRDAFEVALYHYAIRKKMPILGICRGMQLINIADGGMIFQDIYRQNENLLEHSQQVASTHKIHKVTCIENSKLFRMFGANTFLVNSLHHQAVSRLGEHMLATATSSDGIIEGIEHQTMPFVMGVQWHPEWLSDHWIVFRTLIEWCQSPDGFSGATNQ